MNPTVSTPTRRRRLRQLCAAFAVAVMSTTALSSALTAAAPPTTDPRTAGAYAAGWMAQQLDDAIPLVNFGSPDWGVTLDAAISLAATETGGEQLDAVWSALVADRDTVIDPFSSGDQPGRLARVILLAHALGEDPMAVGAAPGDDLVARLLATQTLAGPDAGLFGDPTVVSPTYDGAFRQSYSIAALVAAGATVPTSSWQWLLDQQCADGSWMPYRAEVAGVLEACAFNSTTFVGPDTNSTAAAINGLDAVGQGASSVDAAAAWLATVQNADGGWGLFPGDPSEPSSTGLTWQALVSAGFGTAPEFLDKSASPLATLLSFQLGCSSPEADRGALTYPGSNDAPNTFGTAQATPALAGVPVEFGPVDPADSVAVVDCSVPTTTVPTTTTTTTTPSTPSTPTPDATDRPGAAAAARAAARPISFVG